MKTTKDILERTKLTLEDECSARQQLQQEAVANRELMSRQEQKSYVVVLIDADVNIYMASLKISVKEETCSLYAFAHVAHICITV